jgi:hypothetical protein
MRCTPSSLATGHTCYHAGETIDPILSPKRDLIAATMFLRLALLGKGPRPRVINVVGASGQLQRRVHRLVSVDRSTSSHRSESKACCDGGFGKKKKTVLSESS